MMNNNTENAFYLVDMPGMGYAKARKALWAGSLRRLSETDGRGRSVHFVRRVLC